MYRISNKNSLSRITFKHLVFHCRKEVLLTDNPAICDMTPTLTKNIVIRQEYSKQHKQGFANRLLISRRICVTGSYPNFNWCWPIQKVQKWPWRIIIMRLLFCRSAAKWAALITLWFSRFLGPEKIFLTSGKWALEKASRLLVLFLGTGSVIVSGSSAKHSLRCLHKLLRPTHAAWPFWPSFHCVHKLEWRFEKAELEFMWALSVDHYQSTFGKDATACNGGASCDCDELIDQRFYERILMDIKRSLI